jgi:hypothetical protein
MDTAPQPTAGKPRRSIIKPALLWVFFGAGLALQAFSPHLAIEHDSFVIPADAVRPGSVIDPRALVKRERLIQGTSAALVLIGVAGLGIWYRESLVRSLSRK